MQYDKQKTAAQILQETCERALAKLRKDREDGKRKAKADVLHRTIDKTVKNKH